MDGNKKSVFEIVADAVNSIGTGVAASRESGTCGSSWSIRPKQLVAIGLSLVVFLCVGFWLFLPSPPPHPHHSHGHSIVATFKLPIPVSFVKHHVRKLQTNMDYSFGVDNTKVIILSVESNGSYTTDVAFAVDSSPKHSFSLSFLKNIQSLFSAFVVRVASLQLVDAPLFGVPFAFEVVKFPGGITISPIQTPYPPERSLIVFNFTSNHGVHDIQEQFNLLKNQLAKGLYLTANEILYIDLINQSGSTTSPPTIVQASITQKIGVLLKQRRQELSEVIGESVATNLGLNKTLFGKVEYIS